MIEPAALSKPVVIGPFTGNFAEPMTHFMAAGAMRVVHDGAELTRAISDLLSDPAAAAVMGRRAGEVVMKQKGATQRHARVILDLI
jgi:3-deoxy-D-manno-octulosonic-acid transferase